MSIPLHRAVPAAMPRLQPWIFAGSTLAALALAALVRLRLDPAAPLWFDETGTGAFASAPSLAALTEQVHADVNAPVYYYLVWAWARFFGVSNVALHGLSLALGALTPLVAWAGLARGRSVVALAWAVLLATWLPGITLSDEARCYPLLFCAAAVSTLAHVRLLAAPSLGRAAAWAACASFATLVHYYAGLLALTQGLAFLALHRGRALRLWPAALAFAPCFAFMAWHASRLATFAQPDIAWYHLVSASDLPLALLVMAGGPLTLAGFAAALVAGVLPIPSLERAAPDGRSRADEALLWAGGAALAAAALSLAIGMVRPSFAFRYFVPFVPGVSLLAAAWVVRIGRMPYVAATVLVAGPLLAMAFTVAAEPDKGQRLYSFEAASAWIAEAGPSRLVFFWDNPATPIMPRGFFDAVGGFFIRRAGGTVEVIPLYPTDTDMNGPALAAAGPDAGVLWVYDILIRHTTATDHPPRLSTLDPGLECRDFGASNVGVFACRRRPHH